MPVIAGDYPNGNLKTIIDGAADGETIILTGNAYTFTSGGKVTTAKSLTIKADPTLLSRPVATLPAGVYITHTSSIPATITFDGIEFNGNATATGLIQGKSAAGGNLAITINNCKFTNFAATSIAVSYVGTGGITDLIYNDLSITNCEFIGPFQSILVAAAKINSPNNFLFQNCYIKGFGGSGVIVVNYAVAGANSVTVNHCTFDQCTATKCEFKIVSGVNTTIKNTLISASGTTTAGIFGTAVSNTNNALFTPNPSFHSSWQGVSITTDPVIGTNYVATASEYYNAGSDGKTIGYVGPNGIPTAIQNQNKTSSIALNIIQNGTSYTINSQNAPFAVYATNGSQVANGQIINEKINLNLNKGIYILKSNGKVAKFTVK